MHAHYFNIVIFVCVHLTWAPFELYVMCVSVLASFDSFILFFCFLFSEIEVLYGGTEVFDFQVQSAVNHDKYLAGVSLILVFPLVFILSGFSLFSTFTAILTILTSFPIAFFIYRVVFGIKAVGLLNVVSLFVIIGIGVDDVFVFLNTFKLAGDLKGVKTIQDRLAYTIIHASKATFLTSATTAVAFLANTLSAVCVCVYVCMYVCVCTYVCL